MIVVTLTLKDEKQLALLQEALADMACMDEAEEFEMHINFNSDNSSKE